MQKKEEVPRNGLLFPSFCDAHAFIKKYMDSCQELFTIKTSNLIPITKPYSKILRYKKVVYYCKRGGNEYKTKGKGIRDTRTFKIGCTTSFTLKLTADNNNLEIIECDLAHTKHEPTGNMYKLYPENRRLTPE
ncbi:uncharacterized protein LOC123266370 [Cotesia glomerata]|uniref:FAR1 domain-containing protein n=1 Tax=Cotesia glomerata TaxID=32391 RepID=A0AAV7IHQ8_COTGL|nr:uncharacterized protein LOC123266370 [Cotesia glomerata]KAH0561185.1 hypothetical protein KQX54_014198 [Cotesia glomerata]